MTVINYKPLSVNGAWQGRRFKTDEYKTFERDLLLMLPRMTMPPAPYSLRFEFGMSRLSDIDNPVKPTLDVLQKKYGINDRDVIELFVRKTTVKKGGEFIAFTIETVQ